RNADGRADRSSMPRRRQRIWRALGPFEFPCRAAKTRGKNRTPARNLLLSSPKSLSLANTYEPASSGNTQARRGSGEAAGERRREDPIGLGSLASSLAVIGLDRDAEMARLARRQLTDCRAWGPAASSGRLSRCCRNCRRTE